MMKNFSNKTSGVLTSIDMRQNKYKLLYWCIFAILVVGVLITFVPCIWVILSGFKDVKEMYTIPVKIFPKQIKLSKIAVVWQELQFQDYYLSTFVMAIGSVISCCLLCGLSGFVLSKLKPAGHKYIFALLFWVMLMPGVMRTVPLYMTFIDFPIFHFNLVNTYWGLWMLAATNVFDIILFKNSFDTISTSIVESAKLDGCSSVRIFASIILPLSAPVFIVVALFTFNGQMENFLWPLLLLTNKKLMVLSVKLYKMKQETFTADYQMMAIIFASLPQMLIFAFFHRKIIGGINVGGVKG